MPCGLEFNTRCHRWAATSKFESRAAIDYHSIPCRIILLADDRFARTPGLLPARRGSAQPRNRVDAVLLDSHLVSFCIPDRQCGDPGSECRRPGPRVRRAMEDL